MTTLSPTWDKSCPDYYVEWSVNPSYSSGHSHDDSGSDEYGNCECYRDGGNTWAGDIDVYDGQGGYGITQSFCEDNGPAQCLEEGFTCDGGAFTVSWVYDDMYTGANFGGPPPDSDHYHDDSGSGGSTLDEYGDCECQCPGGGSFDPQYFPNHAGADPDGLTQSECESSFAKSACTQVWEDMVSRNDPHPCPGPSGGSVDDVYTIWTAGYTGPGSGP